VRPRVEWDDGPSLLSFTRSRKRWNGLVEDLRR
jgi:hypothetical protein